MSKVYFNNIGPKIDKQYSPYPANKNLPEWYKKINPYFFEEKSIESSTIKKCMPILDSISLGYILPLPCDFYIQNMPTGDQNINCGIRADLSYFEEHPIDQASGHPLENGMPYKKWLNPWQIKTEDGYSCLIINPLHRKSPINILDAVVDTDKYYSTINIVFTIDKSFNGILKAGTPLAQIVPFRREGFESIISNEKNTNDIIKEKLLSVKTNRYKKLFWQKKEYV